MLTRTSILALALGLCLTTAAEPAGGVRSAHTTASLISDTFAAVPGSTIRVGLRLQPDKGWHTYWTNPGDAGYAPSVKWSLPEGVVADVLDFPVPRINHGLVTTYDYPGDVIHVATLSIPASYSGDSIPIKVEASWLACKENCVPGDASLSLEIKIAPRTVGNVVGKTLINRRNMPKPLPEGWQISAVSAGNAVTFALTGPDALSPKTRLLLTNEGVIEPGAKQTWTKSGKTYSLTITAGPTTAKSPLIGLLLLPDATAYTFTAHLK